jgi:hypothetical protein
MHDILKYLFNYQVLDLIEEQTKKINQPINALLLVGGFAGCEYLYQKVHVSLIEGSHEFFL